MAVTQTEMAADHRPPLLCFAHLGNEEKDKHRSASKCGQSGHFLPCSEMSGLMREIAVPSQSLSGTVRTVVSPRQC